MDQHTEGIKKSIDDIIGSDTTLKQKRKTEDIINKERFEKIIHLLEELEVRSLISKNELGVDYDLYDNKFYDVIELLLELHFGKEACELIFFYLYDRIGPNGGINILIDSNKNQIILNNPNDLWELLKIVNVKKAK